MEKLIELLNEYHHFNSDLIGYFYDDEYDKFYFRTELPEEEKEKLNKAGVKLEDDGIDETWIENEWICSKKFGFIKWLVDNDKIDIEKVIDTAKSSVIDTYYYEEGIDDIYIPLLMVLAVEDESIEFLISILK